MRIYCCECGKDVPAELVKGNVIYPHRPDLYNHNFYRCPYCGQYVGTHRGTSRPLGCIPTDELKIARHKVHTMMDPLWQSNLISRKGLYKIISEEVGYKYHNGDTRSVTECVKVMDIIKRVKDNLNEL